MEPSILRGAGSGSRETMQRIRRVFVESLHLNLPEENFSYEAQLDETVGLDSVAVIEFITALEQEFGITFEPEVLTIELVRSIQDLAAYIDERKMRGLNGCAQAERKRIVERTP
jgi:acyl carrier protein